MVRAAQPGRGGGKIQRPNFLFLIADDLTFRAVGGLGNREVETPALDGLMRRGVTFTHCFHQGSWSGAVCIASRTMLNCGMSAFRAEKKFESVPLWGETFRKAGYETCLVGKWHLSRAALQRSFSDIGPVAPGMFESGPDAYNRPSPGNTWTPWDKTRKGQWLHTRQWLGAERDEIRHSAEIWADVAIEKLRKAAARTQPFLTYVGFNSPHDPRQAPREFVERYPRQRIGIPPNYQKEHPFDQGDHRIRDEVLAPFPRTEDAVRLHRAEYYAHITYMDQQIGRILKSLDETGAAENTYVIFTSDHGLAVGEHGLMGKQNQYDHSTRVPFFIAGPGVPRGKKIDTLVYQHSTFATACDLARIPVPSTVEFPSLAGLLNGDRQAPHDAVFCWYRDLQRSVRTEQHKLIVYPQAGVTQLFDLARDPWETKDLSSERTLAPVKDALLQRLRRFQKELEDSGPAV